MLSEMEFLNTQLIWGKIAMNLGEDCAKACTQQKDTSKNGICRRLIPASSQTEWLRVE